MMVLRDRRRMLLITLLAMVMVVLIPQCYGAECFECHGPYGTTDCGLNFNNDLMMLNSTATCNGSCFATTYNFTQVTRGCVPDGTSLHQGCFYEDNAGVDVFRCNYVCSGDYCNGAGVLPARKCFACDSEYSSYSCGLNFNNSQMISSKNTLECLSGKCLATTTDGLSHVTRGCVPQGELIRQGCFYEALANGTDVFRCNYVCSSDYCNGAGVIPARKCFACDGKYHAPFCGIGFDNSLMISSGNVVECPGKCLAKTAVAANRVNRGCQTADSQHVGCFYESQSVNGNVQDVFVCNYACNVDYCNGAGILPGDGSTVPRVTRTTLPSPSDASRVALHCLAFCYFRWLFYFFIFIM